MYISFKSELDAHSRLNVNPSGTKFGIFLENKVNTTMAVDALDICITQTPTAIELTG